MKKMFGLSILLGALLPALTACPGSSPNGLPPVSGGTSTAYVMTGTVKDAQGNPLAGVEVFADNTLYYDMNALGTTDASGRYTIKLPTNELGTWRPGAYVERDYHGTHHRFRLYADDESAFSASSGAVRNFVWRLSGKRGDGHLGGLVYVYGDYANGGVDFERVTFTLTPNGPLVDGSAGAPITAKLEGGQITDVPVGRYTLTARYQPEGGAAERLLVKTKHATQFAVSATDHFRTGNYGTTLEFIVQRPEQP